MAQIKCISIDIDGTLIKETSRKVKDIAPRNIVALKRYCENGGKFILSTGRDIPGAKAVFQYLLTQGVPRECIPFLVCRNGAIVLDTAESDIVFQQSFCANLCKKAVRFCLDLKLLFFLTNLDGEVIFKPGLLAKILLPFVFKKSIYKRRKYSDDVSLKNICKFIIVTRSPTIKDLKKQITKEFGDSCYCSLGSRFFLEIVDSRINKFFGIKEVAEKMEITTPDFAAIGNEQNDVLSLERTGFGVGVDLKEKGDNLVWNPNMVDFHTTNKSGDAVALAIEEMKKRQLI